MYFFANVRDGIRRRRGDTFIDLFPQYHGGRYHAYNMRASPTMPGRRRNLVVDGQTPVPFRPGRADERFEDEGRGVGCGCGCGCGCSCMPERQRERLGRSQSRAEQRRDGRDEPRRGGIRRVRFDSRPEVMEAQPVQERHIRVLVTTVVGANPYPIERRPEFMVVIPVWATIEDVCDMLSEGEDFGIVMQEGSGGWIDIRDLDFIDGIGEARDGLVVIEYDVKW
ncbi:hypothetical protein BJ878DRAFT_97365 [Calycina marina]|uniref:Uncharacterized protein n=1 Tax=Calycina marina TaxID=1763456 RepID=A0A9P7Z289_9HELO|nr:hypothetical protein BJ878DRAFT_97365 [Calycina marina]